jgi:hypothetical protein
MRELLQRGTESLHGVIGNNLLCCDLRAGWKDDVLPKKPFKLNFHCWLLEPPNGGACRFMPFSFCAERPMHRMLRTKGNANGLNVDCFGGRNIRILPSQTSEKSEVAFLFNEQQVTIGASDCPADRRVDTRFPEIPWGDLVAAINNNERVPPTWFEQ